MNREIFRYARLLLPIVCALLAKGHASPDRDAFRDPPISARPGAFWNWLNGNIDRDRVTYELRQMKEKGMSGAEIWDVAAIRNPASIPAGPEFLSPESAQTIRFALGEARKLGLRMGMITSSGWNAGGTWVEPNWASKVLVVSSIVTTGPATIEQQLPFPEVPKECPRDEQGRPVFALEIAVLAVPESEDRIVAEPQRIVDLTDRTGADGVLRWGVPEGAWRIFRFVCTNTGQVLIVPSPNSKGLFIDFLDPDATRRHLQEIMNRLEITPANAGESGLHYLEVDSMELHEGNPWTDRFRQWFAKYRGYDPQPWMPVLAGWTVKDKDSSDRFLYDYRKAVSDLLIHSHYETGSAFLKQYGMEFVGEAGGPGPPIWDTCPVDALKALGNVDVPRGEFWIQHRNMFLVKEIASASHIYGKPIVDAESFTTWRRWEDPPFVLKMSADRAFAEGLNRLTIHGFAHSPESAGLPGRTYHAGIDINANTTWWPFARPFMDYLARCSYMLQQGLPVADVLWYYGDKAPNFFPEFHNVPEKPRLPGLGRGYDYDVVNTDVILNRLAVKDGRFVLPEGTSYRVLAFPDEVDMPIEVMEKIESLVAAGGVVTGTPPKQVPGLRDHEERSRRMREIAARVWGDSPTSAAHAFGKGRAYRSTPPSRAAYGRVALDDVLRAEGVEPDFLAPGSDVDYIHRTADGADIYFVRNPRPEPVEVRASFRLEHRTPEIWNPTSGEVESAGIFGVEPGRVLLDLRLDAGGATFVVFPRAGSPPPYVAHVRDEHDLAIGISWTLSFPPGWGAPASVSLRELKSWTEFEETGIKYFAGIAEYRTEFEAPRDWLSSGTRVQLDLGEVRDVAEVGINGKTAGIVWKPPYRVDVTGLMTAGGNGITVRVANQWHNRRVGDAQTSPSRRIMKTNQPLPNADAKPLPSGLLGPVRVITNRSAGI
jgi:hypothetical protein